MQKSKHLVYVKGEIDMQYINSNKLNEIKLNKDNFYVLMDFDRTITKAEASVVRIFKNIQHY